MCEPIFAVVVVYNKKCTDSITCRNLLQISDIPIRVLIYDNSTKDFDNRSYCDKMGWTYLGGEGNNGLSIAYNRCVDTAMAQGGNGWICLFDDDTQISVDYFRKLHQATETSNSAIFVPMIYSGKALLSPCILTSWNNTQLFASEEELLQYTGQDLTAINSGMAIRLPVFDTYRYDENIFLDGIDHKFIRDMTARGEHIHVLPYRCLHEFSGHSRPQLDGAKKRFEIFAKDQAYIFRQNKLKYCYLVGKRAAKLSVQYKNTFFIGCFINQLRKK